MIEELIDDGAAQELIEQHEFISRHTAQLLVDQLDSLRACILRRVSLPS